MQIAFITKQRTLLKSVTLLGLVALLGLLVTCVIGGEKAYASTTKDGWEYILDDESQEVAITDYIGSESDVRLPATIDGFPVVSVNFGYNYTLKALDCSGVKTLRFLSVYNGKLEKLNIDGCTALQHIECLNNKLTELDISSCDALTFLECTTNYIEDTAALEAWREEPGHRGMITPQYDAQTGFAVEYQDNGAVIKGWDKRDTKVVLPDQINGHYVVSARLNNCGIEELDISTCFDLAYLDCADNFLKDTSDLEEWAKLEGHEGWLTPQYHESGFIVTIEEDGQYGPGAYLYKYTSPRDKPETLVIPRFIEGQPVRYISAPALQGERLDLTQCTELRAFNSQFGSIKSIDASGLQNLEEFSCSEGHAESVDVSNCSALKKLNCDLNKIRELNLSGCTSLETLSCYSNELTSLDISSCKNLTDLSCTRNHLTTETMSALKADLYAKGYNCTVTPQIDEAGYLLLVDWSVLDDYADRGFVANAGSWTFPKGPYPDDNLPWGNEDEEKRSADSCWTIVSSNPAVMDIYLDGNDVRLWPGDPGTTTITVKYAFQGEFGFYHAESIYEVTIPASANHVTTFDINPESIELDAIGVCPVCGKFHGGGVREVPYELQTERPGEPLNSFFDISVVSDSPDDELVECVSYSGRNYKGNLGLRARTLDSGEVNIAAGSEINGKSEKAFDTIAVSVRDISDTLNSITFSSSENVVMEMYEDKLLLNLFHLEAESEDIFQKSGLSRHHFVRDLISSVTSSNTDVIDPVMDDVNGWIIRAKGSGHATITLKDVFGNTSTCQIAVLASYEVRRFEQDESGSGEYQYGYISSAKGIPGDKTDVIAEEYEGFHAKKVEQQTISADGNTVVNIYYDRNSYKVNWDSNGGTFEGGESSVQTDVLYGAPLEAPTVTKAGYMFAGWSPKLPEGMPAENITLKAQWGKIADTDTNIAVSAPDPGDNKPTLSDSAVKQAVTEANRVMRAIGEGSSTITGLDINAINALKNVLNKNGTDPVSTIVDVKVEKIGKSIRDVYLIEQELQKKGGGGEISVCLDLKVNLVVSKGSNKACVPLTKLEQALTFETYLDPSTIPNESVKIAYIHWSNGTPKYECYDPIMVDYATGKVVFDAKEYSTYAIVTSPMSTPPSGGGAAPAQKFQVTFESNGGSAVAAQEVESGATVTKPADPTREGYTFAGWFADEALTKAWDFTTDKVAAKTTLFAKWNAQSVMFSDVDFNAWYGPAVTFVADSGLMRGYAGTDLFGVGKNLTRAELAVILCRHANPDGDAGYDDVMASTPNNTGMPDVEAGVWYTGAANWAVANGVINGKENADGTRSFDPNGNVTFEEMVAMMVNLAATPDEIAAADMTALDKFVDAATISDWSRASLAWAAQAGIFNGYQEPDGTYIRPLEQITRERAAAVLFNNYA